MIRPTATQTQQQTPTTNSLSKGGILQRKCESCGQHTIAGGECASCAKNKGSLQRKLAIGASNDPLEQEADRVADQVMAAPTHPSVSNAPPRIQRHTGQITEGTDTAPTSVDHVLSSPGRPLDPALQQDMGQRFGQDFSRVRVHTDAAAERSAREVNANAYTVGQNIVFGAGRFTPATHEGRRLIAHELTHVTQQSPSDGRPHSPQSIIHVSPGGSSDVMRRAPTNKRSDDGPAKPVKQPERVAYGSTPLSQKAIEIRRANPDQSGHQNLVVVEFSWKTTDGIEQSQPIKVGIWNQSEVAHSEQELDQYFRKFKASKGGNIKIFVLGIFSERQFCGASSQNCQKLVYESYPDAVKEFAYNYQMPPGAGKGAGENTRNVIRQRIETFRDSGEGADYSTRRDPPPYDEASGGRIASQVRPPPKKSSEDLSPPKQPSDQSASKPKQPTEPAHVAEPPPSQKLRYYHGQLRTVQEIEQIEAEADTAEAAVGGRGKQASNQPTKTSTTPPKAGIVKKAFIIGAIAGSVLSTEGEATAANKAETTSVAPQQPTSGASAIAPGKITPRTASPTSAKPSIKPTVPTTTSFGRREDGASDAPIASPTATKPTIAPGKTTPKAIAQKPPAPPPSKAVVNAAKFQAAAVVIEMAMAKLNEIGKSLQNKDARTKIDEARRDIIDALQKNPGVGAVIEVQFLEPEHRFQDVYWHLTTATNAGKPTIVQNEENRQPQSSFIYVEPMSAAASGDKARQTEPSIEVKTGQEFIAAYMKARGADLSGIGTISIEMYDAIQRGKHMFGFTDINVGGETIRLPDSAYAPIEAAVTNLAEGTTKKKLDRLKGGIDTQQTRLTEKLKDWLGGAIKLTGHELDSARAHYAAASNYLKDKKFGPALESINAGYAQVEEVWSELYEYDYGQRPVAPLMW